MKKIINNYSSQVIYRGEKKELENILKILCQIWGTGFEEQISIFSKEDKKIEGPDQRMYYNLERILYISNSSKPKFLFPIILKISKKADEKFSEKYGKIDMIEK